MFNDVSHNSKSTSNQKEETYGSNVRYSISPPSSCTAGRIRVSNSSLIIATVSESSCNSKYNKSSFSGTTAYHWIAEYDRNLWFVNRIVCYFAQHISNKIPQRFNPNQQVWFNSNPIIELSSHAYISVKRINSAQHRSPIPSIMRIDTKYAPKYLQMLYLLLLLLY